MNREIKFRGQLSHSKEWVYGNLVINKDKKPYIIPSDVLEADGHHLRIDSDDAFWVDDNTVGQYSGLKDKKGVEVYEGDILKFKDGDISHHRIYWDDEQARWFDERLEDGDSQTGYDCFEFVKECEVIGNIYSNPELL